VSGNLVEVTHRHRAVDVRPVAERLAVTPAIDEPVVS
jgi:hypothetical protein